MNELFEVALVILNAVIAYSGITSIWFVTSEATTFHGCALPKGYVINPFASEICGVELQALPDDGDNWKSLKIALWVYLAFSLFSLGFYLFKKVTEWNKFPYVSLLVNFTLFAIISSIIHNYRVVDKPENSSASYALILMIIAMMIAISRVSLLMFDIYQSYKRSGKWYPYEPASKTTGGHYGSGHASGIYGRRRSSTNY